MKPAEEFLLLAAAACMDGKIQDEERSALHTWAAKMGLAAAEADKILQKVAKGGKLPLVKKGTDEQRTALFEKLLSVVTADKRVTSEEISFLKRVGSAFGIEPAEVQGYIEGTVAELKAKLRREKT